MDRKKTTLDILNSLDISNMKQKREREQEQVRAFIANPDEMGISPEEAAKRRMQLLEAAPEDVKAMEEKEMPPAGPILDMPLSEILKRKMKKQGAE